jgi:hypothetical protein
MFGIIGNNSVKLSVDERLSYNEPANPGTANLLIGRLWAKRR